MDEQNRVTWVTTLCPAGVDMAAHWYQLFGVGANAVRYLHALLAGQDVPAAFWIEVSACGNGYLRQEAVQQLAQVHSPAACSAILLRLNDWVPQVRHAAADVVNAMLTACDIEWVIGGLPALLRLLSMRRHSHAALKQRFDQMLCKEIWRDTVLQCLRGLTGASARYLTALLLERLPPDERIDVISRALRHPDPSVQSMAIQAAASFSAPVQLHLLNVAKALPAAGPRCMMMRRLLALLDGPARDALLESMLLDRFGGVRAIALWHLQQAGQTPAALYARIDPTQLHGHALAAWLIEAGRAGLPVAADFLRQLSSHPLPGIRLAAWAIRLSQPSESRFAIARQALLDPARKVRRAMARQIEAEAGFDCAQISALAEVCLAARDVPAAWWLGKTLSPWFRLLLLLEALAANADTALHADVLTALRQWERPSGWHVYIVPGTTESERVRRLLDNQTVSAALGTMPLLNAAIRARVALKQ
ncbi:hypothetical protein JCM19000A_35220 [Silvimonas sp. JCM 19000]